MVSGKKRIRLIELGHQVKVSHHPAAGFFVDSGQGIKIVLREGIPVPAVVLLHRLFLGSPGGIHRQIFAILIQVVDTADNIVIPLCGGRGIKILLYTQVNTDLPCVFFL